MAILLREVFVAHRVERRLIVLTDPNLALQRRIFRLRAFGYFAIFLAVAQRDVYRTARTDWVVNLFTGVCIAVGVALVTIGFTLANKHGR